MQELVRQLYAPQGCNNWRESVEQLEALMLDQGEPMEVEIIHHHAQGLYAREMRGPKGSLITGRIHLVEHLVIVSAGAVLISDETGVRHITAPATFITQPGIKRVLYGLTDYVLTTVHATDETDVDTLETMLTAGTYAEASEREELPCHS